MGADDATLFMLISPMLQYCAGFALYLKGKRESWKMLRAYTESDAASPTRFAPCVLRRRAL
jgi:hypothetical protein